MALMNEASERRNHIFGTVNRRGIIDAPPTFGFAGLGERIVSHAVGMLLVLREWPTLSALVSQQFVERGIDVWHAWMRMQQFTSAAGHGNARRDDDDTDRVESTDADPDFEHASDATAARVQDSARSGDPVQPDKLSQHRRSEVPRSIRKRPSLRVCFDRGARLQHADFPRHVANVPP